jgi:hypothetical protein
VKWLRNGRHVFKKNSRRYKGITAKIESAMLRWGPLQCGNYDEVQLKNDVSHKVELTNTRGLKEENIDV